MSLLSSNTFLKLSLSSAFTRPKPLLEARTTVTTVGSGPKKDECDKKYELKEIRNKENHHKENSAQKPDTCYFVWQIYFWHQTL